MLEYRVQPFHVERWTGNELVKFARYHARKVRELEQQEAG